MVRRAVRVQLNIDKAYFLVISTNINRRGEKLTAVTNLESLNSVINITEQEKMFTSCTPAVWEDPDTIRKLKDFLKQTS